MALKYLLDTSVLLAAFWQSQQEHQRVNTWLTGKEVATCSITEIGFLRISVQPKGPFQASMPEAILALDSLIKRFGSKVIPDDLTGTETPRTASHNTIGDFHLAELAHRSGMKLATLDTRIKHPAVVVI